jgi:hypothetical protein
MHYYKYSLMLTLLLIGAVTSAQDFSHLSQSEFKFGIHILTGYQNGGI